MEFLYLADWFPTIEKTQATGNEARWVLRDAYEASDFVFYPSLLEGFGNALLEAVYYRRPFLINRYPVYVADIEPCGFRAVSIDGAATDRAAAEVVELLADTSRTRLMVEHNYAVGLRHFSYRVADRVLAQVLADLRFQL